MKKNEETLNGQIGETLTSKTEELIKRHKVPNSPFEHIEAEGEHFLVIGNCRVSDKFNTEEEMDEWMNEYQWDLIVNTMFAVMDMRDKMKYGKGILSSGQSEEIIQQQ